MHDDLRTEGAQVPHRLFKHGQFVPTADIARRILVHRLQPQLHKQRFFLRQVCEDA